MWRLKGTTLVRVRRSLERARELNWTAPISNMELPPKNQSLINQFPKPITSDKWREGFFIIDSFRAAAAEFLLKTPPKVVISEFLEIAKSFFPNGKECKLANGVLDKLATEILST